MIEQIYEMEGIDVVTVEDGGMDNPSFTSEDMPSFLRDRESKIHTIQELLEKSNPLTLTP